MHVGVFQNQETLGFDLLAILSGLGHLSACILSKPVLLLNKKRSIFACYESCAVSFVRIALACFTERKCNLVKSLFINGNFYKR